MHAGLSWLPGNVQNTLVQGIPSLSGPSLEQLKGVTLARAMSFLLKAGFGVLFTDEISDRAMVFFKENFEIIDPEAPEGIRYYQGKFLIRTRKPGDDMNVFLRFCPYPEEVIKKDQHGKEDLQGTKIVVAEALSESEALQREIQADLVLYFRDVNAMIGLVTSGGVDLTQMLLDNVVHIKGNTGHLFKLGAIASNLQALFN